MFKVVRGQSKHITKTQHSSGAIKCCTTTHIIKENTVVIDQDGIVVLWFLKNWIEAKVLEEMDAWITSEVNFQKLAKSNIKDSRGQMPTISFGVWQRRGGSYSFYFTPATKKDIGQAFLNKFKCVWDKVAGAVEMVDKDYATTVRSLHCLPRYFGLFSFGVLNMLSPTKLHKDPRDFRLSCSIPFGNFTDGNIWFPYLGLEVEARTSDVALFNSKNHYHTVKRVEGNRKSMALANHTSTLSAYRNNFGIAGVGGESR